VLIMVGKSLLRQENTLKPSFIYEKVHGEKLPKKLFLKRKNSEKIPKKFRIETETRHALIFLHVYGSFTEYLRMETISKVGKARREFFLNFYFPQNPNANFGEKILKKSNETKS